MPIAPGPRLIDLGNPLADHPLNDGLVAWWQGLAQNTGGPLQFDLSRNKAHATNSACVWRPPSRPGALGYTLDHGGSPAYATATIPVSLTEFSICFWINPRGSGVYQHTVEAGFQTFLDPSNVWYPHSSAGAGPTITANVWTWLCATYSGTAQETNGYVNGILRHTGTCDPILSTAVVFGRYYDSAIEYLVGQLDDIRIYDRVLTAAEIPRLFDQSIRGNPDTLRRSSPVTRVFGSTAAPAGGTFTKLVGSGGLAGVGGGIVGPGGLAG